MVDRLLELFSHDICGVCGGVGGALCETCVSEFERPEGEPRRVYDSSSDLQQVVFPFLYTGRAAQAVGRLKFSRVTSLGLELGLLLKREMGSLPLDAFDLIVPVPIHKSREYQRGFNQSVLMCQAFDQGQVSDCLERIRKTVPQTRLKHEQRLENLRGAFKADNRVDGKSVLLIDDVSTSGGTAIACAEALVDSGAVRVQMAALCG